MIQITHGIGATNLRGEYSKRPPPTSTYQLHLSQETTSSLSDLQWELLELFTYMPLDEDPTIQHELEVNSVLRKMLDVQALTIKQHKGPIQLTIRTPKFYLL